MSASINIREYIKSKYQHILDAYVEDHGCNGLDMLYAQTDTQDVDELLEHYLI